MITVMTPLTLALAKALGVYMLAAGLSGLIAPTRWRAILDGLRASDALVYVTGVFTFALGATLVLLHTVWTDPLAIAVTLVGWAAAIEGVVLIAYPEPLLKLGASMLRPGIARPYAIVAIVIGAVFLFAGLFGRAGL